MRILAIADSPERLLYDAFAPAAWRGHVDLVISCGDLDREYLEFLVSALDVPLLYVAGNHDTAYRTHPPEGCEDLADRLLTIGGLRLAGISGSLRYNAGPEAYQYTERQMGWRLRRLGWQVRWAGGVDLVASHAAPLHRRPNLDATDWAHRGSAGFRRFIERYRPRYWLHGHNHLFLPWTPRVSRIAETTVINAYGHYLFDTTAPLPMLPIGAVVSKQLPPA
jgi:Icc-related predicted phosphoesterase